MKYVAVAVAIVAVATFTFVYVAINNMCGDDYWPDWA
jgi:hypothetical protein